MFLGNKVAIFRLEDYQKFMGMSLGGWVFLTSGEVIVMWDKRIVELIEECIGEFSVACLFKKVEDEFEWAFAGVYGPSRRLMWDEIARVYTWWDMPWCIGGDFNVTWFPSERLGETWFDLAMADFSDFILDLELLDLPLVRGAFTWSHNRAWPRLDRFLVSLFLEGFRKECQGYVWTIFLSYWMWGYS